MTTDSVIAADQYYCPECGFEWGGYNRPPPYAHCPECRDAVMRQVVSTSASET